MADDSLRQLRLKIGRSRRLIDRRFRDATDGVRLILTLRKQWRQASWSRLWTSFALGLFSAADVRKYRIVKLLRDKLEQWPSRGLWSAFWNEVAGPEPVLAPPSAEPTARADDAARMPPPLSAAQPARAGDAEISPATTPTQSKESP